MPTVLAFAHARFDGVVPLIVGPVKPWEQGSTGVGPTYMHRTPKTGRQASLALTSLGNRVLTLRKTFRPKDAVHTKLGR